MNWTLLLLIIIAILLARCEMRLAELLGEAQDLAHRAKRRYPITRQEEQEADDAAEGDAWATADTRRSARSQPAASSLRL